MQFINQIGAFKVKINKVINKEAKGMAKPAYYVEFADDKGAVISTRLNKPLNEFDYAKIAKILSLFKGKIDKDMAKKAGETRSIQAINSLVGSELVVYVKVDDFKGKNFFQAFDFVDASKAQFIQGDSNADFSADPFASVDSALDVFSGAQIKDNDDNLPF